MELNIGANIKRLRLARGMTQEGLAARLNLSAAAVSKWEARGTYPDITMLFPLAEILGVEIGELLGYDEAKARAEITDMLAAYRRLHTEGRPEEAHALIVSLRERYPQDFSIMQVYIGDHIKGKLNDEQAEELAQLCDCISEGCTRDDIRIFALESRARLLHRAGKTDEALALLSTLPQTQASLAKEGLFDKGSEEFRYWNTRNGYSLAEASAIRQARDVRYNPVLTHSEKCARLEAMADAYTAFAHTPDLQGHILSAVGVLGVLIGMLTGGEIEAEALTRIKEKQLRALAEMERVAEGDEVLREMITTLYRGEAPVAWEVNRALTSPHPAIAALREVPAYRELLLRWETTGG